MRTLLTIKDDALREKLLNVNILITKIEALKDNPTPSFDLVTKSSSTSLNFFLKETNTFDNSLPKSETFCFNLEEISSGSPTSYLDFSLPDYEEFFYESEPDPGDLTSIIDPGIHENISSMTNVNLPFEDDQSPLFAYVVWIFLSFLMYPVAPPYLLSSGNEDTIFDLGISIYHSFMPGVSHQSGTFIKFNVYPNHLNESPMEILSSTLSPMDQ
ncbi:hypothetical protein Tco_0328943 [Tanacetum coccineum]